MKHHVLATLFFGGVVLLFLIGMILCLAILQPKTRYSKTKADEKTRELLRAVQKNRNSNVVFQLLEQDAELLIFTIKMNMAKRLYIMLVNSILSKLWVL